MQKAELTAMALAGLFCAKITGGPPGRALKFWRKYCHPDSNSLSSASYFSEIQPNIVDKGIQLHRLTNCWRVDALA